MASARVVGGRTASAGAAQVVRADDLRFVLGDEAVRAGLKYLQDVNAQRFGSLARRYWFDCLVLVGVGFALAEVVLTQNEKHGPEGPLWFDVLAALAITLPLFLRRRPAGPSHLPVSP